MRNLTTIALVVVLVILLTPKTKASGNISVDLSKPRGMRNNNPGNIKITKEKWQGKVPEDQNTDGVFEQFVSMEYGIRAALKLLYNYYHRFRLTTIRAIIDRWAPPTENITRNYESYISNCMNHDPTSTISYNKQNFTKLAYCIFVYENRVPGFTPVPLSQIQRVWNRYNDELA